MRDNSKPFEDLAAVRVIARLLLVLIGFYILENQAETLPSESPNEVIFSAPGGIYEDDLHLSLRAPAPDTAVRYTLDGSLPTAENGTLYTVPIRLSADTPVVIVVRARVERPGAAPDQTVTQSYIMGVQAELPILSLVIDPDDMWGSERGIYTHIEERGAEWERPVDITFVDEDRSQGFHIAAGVRLHGEWSRHLDKKSFRLYFRSEYGSAQLTYPLFPGNEVTTFDHLVLHNGGNDSTQPSANWTLLRNALVTELASEIGANTTHTRPVLLFINGQSWGIYQLRERIDEKFLEEHYGIEQADILDSPANVWVGTTVAGDSEHWENLLAYVRTHDLRDPTAYDYVATQVDLTNLTDYILLQLYSGNADWPEHNVNQFRARRVGGRWQWIVWDNDYSFGLALHPDAGYEGDIVDLNLVQKLFEDDHVATEGEDTLLIRKLFENPDFRRHFLLRAAELLNTTFTAESVVLHIDELAATLAPDIDYEIARWGSSVNWELSVEEMRDYARRRPDTLREHLIAAFGLAGMADLTFALPNEGEGTVAVSDRVLEELPWTGRYFLGTQIELQAVPAPGYHFTGWADLDSREPELVLPVEGDRTILPLFDPVPPDAPRAGDVTITGYTADDDTTIDGDWFEVRIERCGGIDLRGWRFTDNDGKEATSEGSLILAGIPAFSAIPCGTVLQVIATRSTANDAHFPEDDLAAWDRRMLLYVGNEHLFEGRDAWFDLVTGDNLAVLAPGPTASYADDVGIAFASVNSPISAASFGVLVDGVRETVLTP